MAVITLFLLLLLALVNLPSTVPIGFSAVDFSDSTASSYANASLLPTDQKEKKYTKKPRKKQMMCKKNPKSCKKLSKHHRCCFHRVCENLYSSRDNCGSCGHVCEHGMKCCHGVCVDLKRDRNHCGKCQNVCSPAVNCVFGMCGYD